MTADLLIAGGPIVTLDPRVGRAEAVAVRAGAIAAAGTLDDVRRLRGARTELLDLRGRTLVPGFYDAHQHQLYTGLARQGVDGRAAGIDELVERIGAGAARQPPGSWIEAAGYDDNAFRERRHPTRADLDRAAPGHPVLVTRTCGHAMAVNSRALAAAGVDARTLDPPGGRIERDPATGDPTGVLHEKAMEMVRRRLPPPPPDRLESAIVDAAQENLELGITSVWEPSVEPDHVAAYRRLADGGRLPLRVTMAQKRVLRSGELVPLPEPARGRTLSMAGVKLFQDGAIAPRTAALSTPYAGEPDNRGLLIWPQSELDAVVADAHRAGLQVSIHAIGDEAIRSALAAIEAAVVADPRPHRHRIEHCGLPLGDLPERLGAAGVIPILQPPFLRFHGDAYVRNLGSERAERLYPARTLLEACGVAAASSDGPVVPDASPLLGMEVAMTRRAASGRLVAAQEAVSLAHALYLYTVGAATAAGEEHLKGSIGPGKLADLVVLGDDIRGATGTDLAGVGVDAVIVDGLVVYETS